MFRHDDKMKISFEVATWKCAETVKSCCDYVLSNYDMGQGKKGNNLDATYFPGRNQK